MSNRIELVVINNTGLTIKCTDIKCKTFENLEIGDTIASGGEKTFFSKTNDRIFCTFTEESPGSGSWQLGMTSPKSSKNSAYGSFNAGLQTYDRSGTPATFRFILGSQNLADWNNGSTDKGNTLTYGDCS